MDAIAQNHPNKQSWEMRKKKTIIKINQKQIKTSSITIKKCKKLYCKVDTFGSSIGTTNILRRKLCGAKKGFYLSKQNGWLVASDRKTLASD